MVKQKFRFNIFDIFMALALIAVIIIGVVSYNNKPFLGDRSLLVEVKISNAETITAILPKVKEADKVYYAGTKYPVRQVSYRLENDANGQIKNLYLSIQGPGKIVYGNSIFNGQRVYVNQKVEIRNDYQAKGYVTDFRYEN